MAHMASARCLRASPHLSAPLYGSKATTNPEKTFRLSLLRLANSNDNAAVPNGEVFLKIAARPSWEVGGGVVIVQLA
jgi:hypothetical protein